MSGVVRTNIVAGDNEPYTLTSKYATKSDLLRGIELL